MKRKSTSWLLVLAMLAILLNGVASLFGTMVPISLIMVSVCGAVMMSAILSGLHKKAIGTWLLFSSAVGLALASTVRPGIRFEAHSVIEWGAIAAAGLFAVVCVMQWAELSEEKRPTRNF